MLPKWHILFGAIFTGILYFISPEINPLYLALVFLASFLIDVDHYIQGVRKTGTWNLKRVFDYHIEENKKAERDLKKGIRKKADFHFFHTLEFHILIGLLSFVWVGFFYIFIGLVFHSLFDLYDGLKKGWLYRREFFFFNWLTSVGKEK
jgi:hypothetical protein